MSIQQQLKRANESKVSLQDLQFRSVNYGSAKPIWNGSAFMLDGRRERVLAYDVGQSGWTDDLTKLHEQASKDGSHFIDKASRSFAISEVKRVVPPESPIILEIGCSSGHLLADMRSAFPGASLVGADYTLGTLMALGERLPGVPLVRFDLTRCPLPSNVFDAAVLLNVLEHIEDDGAAVEQIHRILKPGGAAIVEVPAGPDLFNQYDRDLMHFRRYTLDGLSRLFLDRGFVLERRNYLGALLYPPFRLTKRRSKAMNGSGHVSNEIERSSRFNIVGDAIMAVESALRRWITFPAGIRCVLTARKL